MTQQEMSAEDVIFGGGGIPSAKWETVGQWVGGPIRVKPRTYHAKEYVPGQAGQGRPLFKQNGEPVMGVRVDVVTGQRDDNIPHDDGTRRMHLDKWRQLEAVRRALSEAGVSTLDAGGELWVQWTGEESDGNGGQSAKTWNAKYRPPSQGIEVPGAPSPQQFQPNPPAAQVPAPAQAPAGQNYAYPGQGYTGAPGAAPAQAQFPPQAGTYATGPAQNVQPGPMPGAVPPGPPAAAQAPVPTPAPAQAPPVQAQGQAGGQPSNVITASVAAALRAQGVDTSAFTVVPG